MLASILSGIILLIALIFGFRFFTIRRKKKTVDKIRAAWGVPKDEYFGFVSIARFAAYTKGEPSFHSINDQTLHDIDFFSLFRLIDRTTSKIGQQFLFKMLREPRGDSSAPLEKNAILFSADSRLREKIQYQLVKLSSNNAYHIPYLFQGSLLHRPAWLRWLPFSILIIFATVVLSFFNPVFWIFLLVPLTLNMFIHLWNKKNALPFIHSMPQLNLLVTVADEILRSHETLHDQSVRESVNNLAGVQRKTAFVSFNYGGGVEAELTQIGTYVFELVKAFLLIEVFALFNLMRHAESKSVEIRKLFDYVGGIDSALSVASLRAGKLKTCRPQFSSRGSFSAKQMFHPLISGCVGNDLVSKGRSVLITGSNMSGKSTFLRTVAINSLLAQTIHTCFADEFVTPFFRQYSAIRIDDDLLAGRSYYFEEVQVMKSLLDASMQGQSLFVLDEVFKGTNTVERIGAAKAVLSYLSRNDNFVVVATHDIELADLLVNEYDLYHFVETIEGDELKFDHRLKPGKLRTRNAIRLLEMTGYPADVVEDARRVSNTLAVESSWNHVDDASTA